MLFPSTLVTLYANIRSRVQPGYTYVGDMCKDWSGLCRLLDENKLNAAHYMRWMWDFRTRNRPIAYINMLTGPASVKLYMDKADYKDKDREHVLRVKLDIQKDIVLTELTLGRELPEVLVDESLAVGVVMRYALAHCGGLQNLVRQFCVEAEYEISSEPLYLRILGDKLPPVVRARHG